MVKDTKLKNIVMRGACCALLGTLAACGGPVGSSSDPPSVNISGGSSTSSSSSSSSGGSSSSGSSSSSSSSSGGGGVGSSGSSSSSSSGGHSSSSSSSSSGGHSSSSSSSSGGGSSWSTASSSSGGTMAISVHVDAQGGHFINAKGDIIQVRGVNVSGLESGIIFGGTDYWASSNLGGRPNFTKIAAWRANALRLPLNEDSWLGLTVTDQVGTTLALNGAGYQAGGKRKEDT